MKPTFEAQAEAWSHPPVDDVGYISSAQLLQLSDDALRSLIDTLETTRYTGWRNWQNGWREGLLLDVTHDKRVLDYGCGVGVEALQYARNNNRVYLADIVSDNVQLARRVLNVHGFESAGSTMLAEEPPSWGQLFDIIHCAGVLHHIPTPELVVAAMHDWLFPAGELRLMLYSDKGWRRAVGTDPPQVVDEDPGFQQFVSFFDSVGAWADWYDRARLEARFGRWFDIEEVRYITPDGIYLTAILRRR